LRLVASDLAFHIGAERLALTRLAFRWRAPMAVSPPTLLDRLLVRDRAVFRRSLERVLGWPISRIVVAHGAIVDAGGHAALAGGYAWLLGARATGRPSDG
jgi:hypothetical protein